MLFALLFTLCYRAAYKIYIGFYYTYMRAAQRQSKTFSIFVFIIIIMFNVYFWYYTGESLLICLFVFFFSIQYFCQYLMRRVLSIYVQCIACACACMHNQIFINLGYMFILSMKQRCIYDYKFTDYKMLGLVQLGENI